MDPNQQPALPPAAPDGQFNPQQYEFITNPAQPPKKSLVPTINTGGSKPKTILIYLGLASVFLIIVMVLYSVFFGGNSSVDTMKPLLQQQAELQRVAGLGNQKASSTAAQNLAQMTSLSMASQQSELTAYLAKQKVKVSAKYVALGTNKQTDQELATAETNGRFDDAFIQAMRGELTKYQSALQTAYKSAGPTGKAILTNDYNQAGLILKSIPSTTND